MFLAARTRLFLATIALAGAAGGAWYLTARPHGPQARDAVAGMALHADAMRLPVILRDAQSRPMPIRIEAVATVQAPAVVAIRTRVEGEVVKQHIVEGQDVREGQILFSLDARPFEAVKRQTEANLARDRAQLERARADLTRYSELLRAGTTTRQKVELVTAEVSAFEAALRADQASLDAARLNIGYATIRAPISGRTGVINAKQGHMAKPDDGQPMVSITQIQPIQVAFSVAEANLPRIRAAQAHAPLTVRVRSEDDPDLAAEGTLAFIDSSIDSATGTIMLKARFTNDDTRLWPGQFVTAELVLGTEENALTIPAEAVQTGQNGAYLFVVSEGIAQIRGVTVDRIIDGQAVISKGLVPGEKVVVDGQMRLAPGARIVERSAM